METLNLKKKLRYLIALFFIAAGCGHVSEDRTQYQIDLEKIRNNAKSSLASNEEAFKAKVKLEGDKIEVAKKNSAYGLIRVELGCLKSETDLPATAVASALGLNPRSDSYLKCKKHNYSNWLKLIWSCKEELTSFYKGKTSIAIKPGAKLLLLDKLGRTLISLKLTLNNSYESFDPVSDEIFSNVSRLQVLVGEMSFLVEKSDWAHTIVLPDALCGL